MKWVNVELTKTNSDGFRQYLRDNGIKYETSEAGEFIHFECYMSESQIETANGFLKEVCDG